jgi:Domain of unknown function (DUF4440)
MKKFLAVSLALGAICFAAWTADRTITFAADSGNESAVLEADNSLQIALKHKDPKAAGALLDQDFSWVNEAGMTRKKTQFLQDAAAGSVIGDTEYNNMKAHDYGQLVLVTGVGKRTGHAGTFFARVWVKRPAGWMLLTHQDTPILAKGTQSAPTSESKIPGTSTSDCDNPCHTVPITTKTPEQKEVVKAYEAVEVAVTAHDERGWAYHVADEFVGIGRRYTGTPDSKAQRVGQIGISKNKLILPKMVSGDVYVFGDAGIILADHQPVGEPPFHVIRVWVNRDGRWQLFHRQETTIQKPAGAQ